MCFVWKLLNGFRRKFVPEKCTEACRASFVLGIPILLAYDGASLGNWTPTSRNVGHRSTSDAKSCARTENLLDTSVKILKLGRNFVFECDWYKVSVLYSQHLNFAKPIGNKISRNTMGFLSGLPQNLLQGNFQKCHQ